MFGGVLLILIIFILYSKKILKKGWYLMELNYVNKSLVKPINHCIVY